MLRVFKVGALEDAAIAIAWREASRYDSGLAEDKLTAL